MHTGGGKTWLAAGNRAVFLVEVGIDLGPEE